MVATIRTALAVALLASSATASLQLTPTEASEECDGVKLHCLAFFEGSKRITYSPPRGWQYSGGGDRFVLRPNQKGNAEAIIRIVATKPPAFDEAGIKRLRDFAVSSLPPASVHAAVVSAEKCPLVIERKETFLITVEFESYGVAYTRALMFLNRENDQVQFQLTCARADFAQLQREFMASHFSWQNL